MSKPQHALRLAIATTILLVLATGCRTWQAQEGDPAALLVEGEYADVRLLLHDGTTETVTNYSVRNDSVVGTSPGGAVPGPGRTVVAPHPVAVALSDVVEVQVERFSTGRTLVAVGFGVAIVAVIGAIAIQQGMNESERAHNLNSCPLVYSWTGSEWVLDSGTFGGAIMRPLARSDVDNLDHLRADSDGLLRLKVANELAETDYVDALSILAVDHPQGTTVSPDPTGQLHVLGPLASPSAAVDFEGTDALARVRSSDRWAWESPLRIRDPESSAVRDGLMLRFTKPEGSNHALLVLDAHNTAWASYLLGEYVEAHGGGTDAWYASLEAAPGVARQLGERLANEAFLRVSVRQDGAWQVQGMAWEAGPEIAKRQVIPLDLSRVEGSEVEIRLDAPASFWRVDYAGIAWSEPGSNDLAIEELHPEVATAPDGGDLRPLLAQMDGREVDMGTGDAFELEFRPPPRADGMERTYLLNAGGWYRIDTDRLGAPDEELVRRVETEPGAVALIAAERMNEALAALDAAHTSP